MTEQVLTLGTGETVKLGRVRPAKVIDANGYRLTVLQDGTQHVVPLFGAHWNKARMVVSPPSSVDYAPKALPSISRMYRNDIEGDCVIADVMHQLGIWSGNDGDSGGVVLATDQEVHQQYQAICGPGDNGCNIASVLKYWKANGIVAGGKTYKIDGYVGLDWTNKLQVMVAIWLFGTIRLGINLPSAWTQGGDGSLWQPTNSPIVGGHDVGACGFGPQGVTIMTWGGRRLITWEAFLSRQWIEEAWVELAPLWYGNDKLAPCGLDAVTLKADLDMLGGGTVPPLPDPVPPVTPPVVPPVVPPVTPPVVPPTPTPTPEQLFTLTLSQPVPRGGRIVFNSPMPLPAGKYGFVKLSNWGPIQGPPEPIYAASVELTHEAAKDVTVELPGGWTCTSIVAYKQGNIPNFQVQGLSTMQPLVADFPAEAVTVLLPLLRGQLPTDKRLAVTAGVNIISYAANLGFPAPQLGVPVGTGDSVISAESVAEHLERAAAFEHTRGMAGVAIPWRQIIQTLLPLVIQWVTE